MLDYMVGPDSSENGVIRYYGDEEIENTKRKMEEGEENLDKGARKKRYVLGQNVGKWTEEEHNRFVLALKKFGRNWTLVQQEVKTRTLVQIRSHAQKYFLKKVRGIVPSNLTMDSKLISTASDGIVPTWLLQEESNYANKSSLNTNISNMSLNCNEGAVATNNRSDAGIGANYSNAILNSESSCSKSSIDSSLSVGIGLHNMNIQQKAAEGHIYGIYEQNLSNDPIIEDGLGIGCGIGMSENSGIRMPRKIINSMPGEHISYSGITNNSSGSLLVDDFNTDCFSYQNDYKDYLGRNSEVDGIKYDHKGMFSARNVVNDGLNDRNSSMESNSMFSTAVPSPASLCPEKNYVPASSIALDTILMPPTVEIDNQNNDNLNHGFQVNFYNCNEAVNTNSCEADGGAALLSDGNHNANYCFSENEKILNPRISLSHCGVPWSITGSDQFLNFCDNSIISTPSPSSSSSISYFDLDTTGNDSKQLSNNSLFSPNKHYEMSNSLSDFIYCGDSLGIDVLNVSHNFRDTTNHIINSSDVNYII